MSSIQQIPLPIIDFLTKEDGGIVEVHQLTSMNQSSVHLISTKRARYVAKRPLHEREIQFYHLAATTMRREHLDVPFLFWHEEQPAGPWIVIEYLPNILPEHRWCADKEIVRYLTGLHALTPQLLTCNINFWKPSWSDQYNQVVLKGIDPRDRVKVAPLLNQFRQMSSSFWDKQVVISGDANPRNWGIRSDGSLVAFDWQKVGLGPAAIDLATYICTDESLDHALIVARQYVEGLPASHIMAGTKPETLARQILICCVWNYVQFLNDYQANKKSVPEKVVDHIYMIFPDWLESAYESLRQSTRQDH